MSDATHELNDVWCLWNLPNITGDMSTKYGSWEKASLELTKNVHAIKSVEEFWVCFDAIPPATKLSKDENIMFFRKGVEPKWEDAAFKTEKGGGRFLFKLDALGSADKFIQALLVHTLGEQFSVETNSARLVAGVRYAKKDNRRDIHVRVEAWITDASKAEELQALFVALAVECGIDNLLSNKENLVFKPF